MVLVGESRRGCSPTLSEVVPSIGTAVGRLFGILCWDRVYGVYGGQTSVTKIINALKRDKKDGTVIPNLRV